MTHNRCGKIMKKRVVQRSLFPLLAALSPLPCLGGEQCGGMDPMPSVSTFLGATLDYAVADRICCHNHRFAERWGYFNTPEIDLFSRLDPTVETVFYDSVCGIPLFIAPRGRSFEAFRDESVRHGWPSFRPGEVVSENVIIHDGGRMESKCGTHLGHNLPKGGVDRYCIDLVCIAGTPTDGVAVPADEGVLTAEELNSTEYKSSAAQWSGKYPDTMGKVKVAAIVVGSLVAACMAAWLCWVKRFWTRSGAAPPKGATDSEEKEFADEWSTEISAVEVASK